MRCLSSQYPSTFTTYQRYTDKFVGQFVAQAGGCHAQVPRPRSFCTGTPNKIGFLYLSTRPFFLWYYACFMVRILGLCSVLCGPASSLPLRRCALCVCVYSHACVYHTHTHKHVSGSACAMGYGYIYIYVYTYVSNNGFCSS